MINKILSIFRKPEVVKDPLNGYVVGAGYDLLISDP